MTLDRPRLLAELATVCAIPVTPFHPDGSVDWDAYRRTVIAIVDGGVRTVTPNGNTGEFYALSPDECDRAVEVTADAVGTRSLVMPGIGYDVRTAIRMGEVALRAGSRAVMVHQPVHPYQSSDGWVEYHAAIAKALPGLGIVPYLRDPNVTAAMLRRLTEYPNFVGVKFAVPNPLHFAAIAAAVGLDAVTWVCGLAEGWAPFFWVGGAVGFTSGLVNVTTGPSFAMLEALRHGNYDQAMVVWRQVKAFEDLRARRNAANNVPIVKEAMAQLGLCERTVRPPISEVPDAEKAEVTALLASLGLG